MISQFIVNEFLFVFLMTIALTAIALEIFIPSFGVIGLAGAYLLFESIMSVKNISNPFKYIAISILLAIVLSTVLIRLVLKSKRGNKLVLDASIKESSGLDREDLKSDLIGREARVIKKLRPAGMIQVGEDQFDAISYGEFIDVGEKVVIDKIEGSKIYCRRF